MPTTTISGVVPDDAARMTFSPWWGVLELDDAHVRRWRIGPRTLWMSRRSQEFSVAHVATDDPFDRTLELGAIDDADAIPREAARMRFAVRGDAPAPELSALLADRAAIVRPDAPLSIPPGEEVTLYVSSPVWLALRLPARADRGEQTLTEIPTWRPSDTWFGPDTQRGELAYALATSGRFAVERGAGPPHRATTPIRVRNRDATALHLERLKVPLPNLSLYASPTRLWTTALVLDRDDDDDRTSLELTSGAPTEAGPDTRTLAAPRQAVAGSLVMRVFSRLFGSS